jgi:asparagine synthetase B (glutamine-hydrolysing)
MIHWDHRNRALVTQPQEFSNSHLELAVERTSVFPFDEAGYSYNPETRVLVSIMGYIANIYDIRDRHHLSQTSDVAIVERLYSTTVGKDRTSFLDDLDGVFLALIYDAKEEKVYLVQSEFGCPLPLYYAETPSAFVFSTSLKLLLQKQPMSRAFHRPSVMDLMFDGDMIPNENTLVRGVRKLVTQRNITIDIPARSRRFESFRCEAETMSREEAETQLVNSIGGSIRRLARQLRQPDVNMTLTGGWDSNVMLSFLNGERAGTINAITINGGGATNEIPAVEHVLKFYPGNAVRHATHTMQSSIFELLPDMVWILEGYMVQTGMLLRYALSRLIRDMGGSSVFLGSGADPMLNAEMGPGGNRVYEPYVEGLRDRLVGELKRTVRNVCKRNWVGDIYFALKKETDEDWIRRKCLRAGFRQRYNTQIEYNMKMHELMLNSFGIRGLYPFINRKTVSCAQPLRPWNDGKALYKEKVREHLGPDISSVLRKSFGVVDTDNLFQANRRWLEKMLNSAFIEKVLSARQVRRMRANPGQYGGVLLKVLYLRLFDELILSGRYDARFGDAHIEETLKEVLS